MPRRLLRDQRRGTRAKPSVSYAEPSSDSDLDLENEGAVSRGENDSDVPLPTQPRKRARPRTSPRKLQRPSSPASSESSTSQILYEPALKKRRHSKPTSPKSAASRAVDHDLLVIGVIPPWQSLPYQILVQIFQYASNPLYNEHTFQPLPSGRWLLNVAGICRAFAEPAFTALYSSPPLVPMDKAHKLVDLLKQDPRSMTFKYRQKVESLRIDVGQVAAYSLPGSGHLNLYRLIKDLPRLVDLEFYHQKDMSPYRNLDDPIKWTYPEELFYALEHVHPKADPLRGDKTRVCRLRSWRWSSRLAGKKFPIDSIREIHLKPSFIELQKIAFVNYQLPLLRKGEEDPKHESLLAESLSALQSLTHVIFESSTLVNAKLLPLLPKNLRNLELINCWEVIADDFAEFLLTHGSQLRCLTLNHNQSLSLAFLPSLGLSCPKLEVFRMNLTYFNLHATYRDSEPQYDNLLLPTEVPAWPSTLQTVELIQLRKWETEAAEMFFQSLLESAESLPDLRKLVIQAILNIGWRDRASFRDKWVGSLSRVFKRVSEPPKIQIKSGGEQSVPDKSVQTQLGANKQLKDGETPLAAAQRRSVRTSSAGDISTRSPRRHTRRTQDSVDHHKDHRSNGQDLEQGPSHPTRRSARTITRQSYSGRYAEVSDNSGNELPYGLSVRGIDRKSRITRELKLLDQATWVGRLAIGPSSPPRTPHLKEDSDAEHSDARNNMQKGKAKELIQGMCEIVDVRIDNLRPMETQATEADFLDSEPEGDLDWVGDDVAIDDGYDW